MTKKFWDDYPEEIKKRAIANYVNSDWRPEIDFSLRNAFSLNETPEGYKFWDFVEDGKYYEALALLTEQESKNREEEAKDHDILHEQIDRLKAENEDLKRTIREGVQQMRMKVWADTFQHFISIQEYQKAKYYANISIQTFNETFGITSPEKQQQ